MKMNVSVELEGATETSGKLVELKKADRRGERRAFEAAEHVQCVCANQHED